MNWKAVIVGAIVFFAVFNVVGFLGTGALIHKAILEPVYEAHESFWQPGITQDSQESTGLIRRWLLNSLLLSLVVAGIYTCVHESFRGGGAKKGMICGLCLAIFTGATYNTLSGVFNLPPGMWLWWAIDAFILYLIGGAAMGWAAEKWGGLKA